MAMAFVFSMTAPSLVLTETELADPKPGFGKPHLIIL